MNFDKFGQAIISESDLVDMLYADPNLEIERFQLTDPDTYNASILATSLDWPQIQQYQPLTMDIDKFDQLQQEQWFVPEQYQNFDIAKWVIDQCTNDHELQRVGHELLLYQERNLFKLLVYLKYLVDTMRDHGIVWGVGRGSSVASFVLYKIGIHRIDSLYYDLDINEFLKD